MTKNWSKNKVPKEISNTIIENALKKCTHLDKIKAELIKELNEKKKRITERIKRQNKLFRIKELKIKNKQDRNNFIIEKRKEGWTLEKIRIPLKITRERIRQILKPFNIPNPPIIKKPLIEKECHRCHKNFKYRYCYRGQRKFCSMKCAEDHRRKYFTEKERKQAISKRITAYTMKKYWSDPIWRRKRLDYYKKWHREQRLRLKNES